MKRTPFIIFVFIVGIVLHAPAVMAAEELEAKAWMQFDKSSRATYVMGFYQGVLKTIRALKLDFRTSELITYEELSEQVYRRLLEERELRAGSTGDIVLNILSNYILVTDRTGKPIPTK